MARIIEKTILTPDIVKMRVHAPVIASRRKAGQFIMLRINDRGERIPLTIVDSNDQDGSVTIIYQIVGKTTHMLSQLQEGDDILDFVGPLGQPTKVEKVGTVAVVGGGIGIAVAYPIAKAMKLVGNEVLAIIGARTKDLLVLEEEIASVSDDIVVTTDDGSYKRKGLVTEPLEEILKSRKLSEVLAIGPVPMMRALRSVIHNNAAPEEAFELFNKLKDSK